jgi:diguanylate cyclase (GGDEF)-like protein/PAS domain S-box-containing protein
MVNGIKNKQSLRFGLYGGLLGLTAPLIYTLIHFLAYHGGIGFGEYVRGLAPEDVMGHVFVGGAVIILSGAGYVLGGLREQDLRNKAEIEAVNESLLEKRRELEELTENLEQKVKDGQEEVIETARKLKVTNAKLLRQIDIQRKIAGSVPSLLALVNPNLSYVEMNEFGARKFLNKPLVDILGHKCFEVVGRNPQICIEECATMKAFESGREHSHSREVSIAGQTIITENKSIPIKNESGEVTHVLQIITDATAKKQQEDELKRRANRDALTGVYNNHYINLYLENEERKNKLEKRRRGPYTVIYADIDNLKVVNDTHGHAAGDIIIKKLAQIFQDNTRHEDIVARVGGDEFVIVLPHQGPEEGELLINRFRREAEDWSRDKKLPEEFKDLKLSASYGLGTSIYGIDITDTIKAADSSMYRTKKSGKSASMHK